MADTVQRNESAVSFAWLSERVGPLARQRWDAIRKRMLLVDQSIGYVQDWVSDFWLARGSNFEIGMLMPKWDPPEGVDEWPTLGVDTLGNLPGTRTNHAAFVNLLQGNAESATSDHQQALDEFMRRESEIERRGDLRMVQGEHVRAWLGTALGRILMSVALTPQDSTAALIQKTVERLAMPLRFELTGGRAVNAFEERRLDLLYNLRVSQDTTLVASEIRSGQGETWREHWVWLTREIRAAEAVDALQVAARLMRCVPLLSGLLLALQSDHECRRWRWRWCDAAC